MSSRFKWETMFDYLKYEDPDRLELARDVARLRKDLKLFPRKKCRHDSINMGVEIAILHSKMLGTSDKLQEAKSILSLVQEEKRNLMKLKRMQEVQEIEKAVGLGDRPFRHDSMTKKIRRLRRSLGLEEKPRRRYPRGSDVMFSLPDVYDSRLSR
ncbi:uncharacterized protein LOC144359995, partial [Saccoglossus kowalevskii]